jgi:hypothetical protein
MMAQTNGCQSREVIEDDEEACGTVSWPGGRRSVVVEDGRLTEEEVVRDGALPGDVADGSSLMVLLHLQ